MEIKRKHVFIVGFNLYTVAIWLWFILAFVTKGVAHLPNALAEVYLLILVFYAGDKELHRWHHDGRMPRRRGEFFVYAWAFIGIGTYVIEQLGGASHGWVVPKDLGLVVWSVIIIYVITEFLKTEFHKKH